MASYPTRFKLPTRYSTEIGRIITRYALLESKLRKIIFLLLDISPKQGRVAVRAARTDDAIDITRQLLKLRGFTTTQDLNELKKECCKIRRFRDGLAHGVWVKHERTKTPVLQVVSGSYAASPGGPSVKARITPKALEVHIEDFKKFLRGIDAALGVVDAIGHEIDDQRHA